MPCIRTISLALTCLFIPFSTEQLHALEPTTVIAIACGAAATGFVTNELAHRWKRRRVHPAIVSRASQERLTHLETQMRALDALGARFSVDAAEQGTLSEQDLLAARQHTNSINSDLVAVQEQIAAGIESEEAAQHLGVIHQLVRNRTTCDTFKLRVRRFETELSTIEQIRKVAAAFRGAQREYGQLLGQSNNPGEMNPQALIACSLSDGISVADRLHKGRELCTRMGAFAQQLREYSANRLAHDAEEHARTWQAQLEYLHTNGQIIGQLRMEQHELAGQLQARVQQCETALSSAHAREAQLRNHAADLEHTIARLRRQIAATATTHARLRSAEMQRVRESHAQERSQWERTREELQQSLRACQSTRESLRIQLQRLQQEQPAQLRPAAGPGRLPIRPEMSAGISHPIDQGPPAGPGMLRGPR